MNVLETSSNFLLSLNKYQLSCCNRKRHLHTFLFEWKCICITSFGGSTKPSLLNRMSIRFCWILSFSLHFLFSQQDFSSKKFHCQFLQGFLPRILVSLGMPWKLIIAWSVLKKFEFSQQAIFTNLFLNIIRKKYHTFIMRFCTTIVIRKKCKFWLGNKVPPRSLKSDS